jgi:hypothetical protein
MHGKQSQLWMELFERAASEQDSNKLVELVEQITRLSEPKEEWVNCESAFYQLSCPPQDDLLRSFHSNRTWADWAASATPRVHGGRYPN